MGLFRRNRKDTFAILQFELQICKMQMESVFLINSNDHSVSKGLKIFYVQCCREQHMQPHKCFADIGAYSATFIQHIKWDKNPDVQITTNVSRAT